jgi:hypothetical protein
MLLCGSLSHSRTAPSKNAPRRAGNAPFGIVDLVLREEAMIDNRLLAAILLAGFLCGCASTGSKRPPSAERLLALYAERLKSVSLQKPAGDFDLAISPEGRVDLDVRHAPLMEVLRQLLERGRRPYRISGPPIERTISETFRGIPLEEACTQLLSSTRGRCSTEGDVLVVALRDADPPVPEPATGQATVVRRVLLRSLSARRAETMLEGLYSDSQKETPAVHFGIDDATNTVALTGSAAAVERVARLLETADVPLHHVLIEANIFAVETSVLQRLGAKLTGSSGAFSDVAVNLGSLLAGGIQFTRIAGANNVTAFTAMIDVLLATEAAQVVARPFVGVVSGEEATVSVTNDRQVAVLSEAGFAPVTTSVSSGVQLKFEAVVRPGGMIRLEVAVEESTFVPTVEGAVSEVARATAATTMEVPSGQSVVIGGLAFHRSSDSRTGPPGLRDIPLLGLLFGGRGETRKDAQLIVVVTPRQWQPGMDHPPPIEEISERLP